jgi:AcrR family transcriptional regulator
MEKLYSNIKITVPEKIFLKDPETSKLGKKIIEKSIFLIDEIGFEKFTFKKLGNEIASNESSIYRYFENKHKLLVYLFSWYWGWVEYQLVFETHYLKNPSEKLNTAIRVLTRTIKEDSNFSHVNEILLHQIMIKENSKTYLTNLVDTENEEGFFLIYKRVVQRLSEMILEKKPDYKFALSLSSTIVEGALHQHFLKTHFTSITDCHTEQKRPTIFFSKLAATLLQ